MSAGRTGQVCWRAVYDSVAFRVQIRQHARVPVCAFRPLGRLCFRGEFVRGAVDEGRASVPSALANHARPTVRSLLHVSVCSSGKHAPRSLGAKGQPGFLEQNPKRDPHLI